LDKDIAIELIRISPTILGIAILLVLLFHFRRQLSDMLSRVGHIKAFGVEAEFAQERKQLSNAAKSYGLTLNEADLNKVIERANRIKDLLTGSRIMWVDDRPLTNASIFRFLNTYGVVIDTATTTDEALDALEWASGAYDAIITDMVRDSGSTAGLDLLRGLKALKIEKPVLIFVAKLDTDKGVPPGATAITNNPIKLIHEFLSSLESSN
jgi:CheY-like chemotaxis protein